MRCPSLAATAAAVLLYTLGWLPPEWSKPACADDIHSHVELSLQMGGDLHILDSQGKSQSIPTSATAQFIYDERLLPADEQAERKAVRIYRRAQATIKVADGGAKPTLRDQRRTLCVQTANQQPVVFCPAGPMTREELDLLEVPLSTLAVDELLPEALPAAGDSWPHPRPLLAVLLNLDEVSTADVRSTVREVLPAAVRVELEGTLKGQDDGAATQCELRGRYQYDPRTRRVTWCSLVIQEKRSIGPVGPGLDVTARLELRRTLRDEIAGLSDRQLAELTLEPTEALLAIEYESPDTRLRLAHDRTWHLISEDPRMIVLRRIADQAMVAQCNITLLAPEGPQERVTLANFRASVEKLLRKNLRRIVSAEEEVDDLGRTRYRVVAEGQSGEADVRWHYYRIITAQGQQAVLVFTVPGDQQSALGEADRELVDRLQLREVVPPAAATRGGESVSR